LYILNQFNIFRNLLENTSSITRVLLFMTIPGHLTFLLIIWQLAIDYTRLSLLFLFLYLAAALIQVKIFPFLLKKFLYVDYFLGCYSSLYCSMDGHVCLGK